MAAKGKQIQSTSSYMVPHQPSHDSSDHEPFLDDEIGELQLDSSTGVEGQPADKHMVQVRSMSFNLIFVHFVQVLVHVLVYIVNIKCLTLCLSR